MIGLTQVTGESSLDGQGGQVEFVFEVVLVPQAIRSMVVGGSADACLDFEERFGMHLRGRCVAERSRYGCCSPWSSCFSGSVSRSISAPISRIVSNTLSIRS